MFRTPYPSQLKCMDVSIIRKRRLQTIAFAPLRETNIPAFSFCEFSILVKKGKEFLCYVGLKPKV